MVNLSKPPLIPRSVLFGNPDIDAARLSPDGQMLSYLAPADGKLGVWIKTVGQADERLVAHDPARPIPMARWQGDGKHILYLQDAGGNENYHLFQVDLLGNPPLDLTPGSNVRAHLVATEFDSPNEALLAMNKRLPSLMDVYRVHFPTATATLETENPGDVLVWMADHRLQVRAVIAQLPSGGYAIRVRDVPASEWSVLDELAFEDGLPRLIGFSGDNRSLYAVTAKGANTNRLVRYDLHDGSYSVLFEHPEHDVEKVYLDPSTNEIAAVAILADRLEWAALSERLEGALASFATLG